MRLLRNSGTERVIDELRRELNETSGLDYISQSFSLPAFTDTRRPLNGLTGCRLILPDVLPTESGLSGSSADRPARNSLTVRWMAVQCVEWVENKVEFKSVSKVPPQSALVLRRGDPMGPTMSISGDCPLTTEGLGLAPGGAMSLIQCSDDPGEAALIGQWFSSIWESLPTSPDAKIAFLAQLGEVASHREPALIYFLTLFHLFQNSEEGLDEETVVKSATGIHNTMVWNKLYKFQRDGVVGAIDKLQRHGGCIIADSVGLGKTFEALAIIKYYELRNDRVLVLCPKRLRDNWTVYKTNDRRNVLAPDRLNYDVLNHTDLSRDGGTSGDIDLSFVNWGNYDLVVIDESHNFRNKIAHRDHDSRYDRLMKKIIQAGVKTRVLMLSATPVNNRLADLKNQIAFITEGDDEALSGAGIQSIEATIRQAQTQFNRWLSLEEVDRKPSRLMDMLGFDYFKLLDLLTIARSRKHIEKYYGTTESGEFPRRLSPVNIKADVDLAAEFPAIREINSEIRHLNLSAYAPLRYVFGHKQRAYDEKYSTRIRGGESFFRQADREESLIQLLRVNLLKRMESSVTSFALTVQRQLADVENLLSKIEAHDTSIEELSIEDIEVDDPAFESLLIGRKVKVLLQDVDRVKWKQELLEDRTRIDQRITKKLLLERSRGTAAQKRSLQEGIDELLWVASLKPNTAGVAAYRDGIREYLEIAILSVRVRADAKPGRLAELIHRAVPYPVFLVMESHAGVEVSLAHKRWSEVEHGETVAEDLHCSVISSEAAAVNGYFLRSLALASVVGAGAHVVDMRVLYQAWIDRVTAQNASSIGGTYTVPATLEDGNNVRRTLQAYAALKREVASLRFEAQKETQVNRRVDLNLAIKRIESEMAGLKTSLGQARQSKTED